MSMYTNVELEKKAVACCLMDPALMKAVPPELITDPVLQKVCTGIYKFLQEYRTIPSVDSYSSRVDTDIATVPMFIEVSELSKSVSLSEFPVYVTDLYDLYCDRTMLLEIDDTLKRVNSERGSRLAGRLASKLSTLRNPLGVGQVTRGFHYERARERWDAYTRVEKEPDQGKGVPFGIQFMDAVTGGLRKTWSYAIRGVKKSGKSKLLFNISYNAARYHKQFVMHVTREMAREWLELCIDSRDTGLEFDGIIKGVLGIGRNTYGNALRIQTERKDPLYIVDMPMMCTTSDLAAEVDLAYHKFGRYPDGIVIDYGGLVLPTQKYTVENERYNFLSQELHELGRQFGMWVVTAYQSTDTGDETAFSRHIADHVETMFEIVDDAAKRQENRMVLRVVANRYGVASGEAELFAPFAINYVGDPGVELSVLGKTVEQSGTIGQNAGLLQRTVS